LLITTGSTIDGADLDMHTYKEKSLSQLETRIAAIESRNRSVSVDKKWETSLTRRIFVCTITYISASLLFIYVIPSPQWYLAALVPVVGYILSTLGLPWARRFWEKFIK